MARKVKMHWGIYKAGNKLFVELNGKHNRTLNMDHEDFPKYVQELKDEITAYSSFTNTKIIEGADLLVSLP